MAVSHQCCALQHLKPCLRAPLSSSEAFNTIRDGKACQGPLKHTQGFTVLNLTLISHA